MDCFKQMKRAPEKRTIRGIELHQEIGRERLYKDVRPIWMRALAALCSAEGQAIIIVSMAASGFIIPALAVPGFFVSCLMVLMRLYCMRNDRLPWRLPKSSKIKRDPGNRRPGTKKYGPAEGIYYVGNDCKTDEELWLSAEDILAHMMNLGTTGSGKTEFFVAWAFNALATGSGFAYIDPKAAPKLAVQIYHHCRMLGRDDDFLVLNFKTGGKDIDSNTRNLSNNTNPFAFGSSDALTQMLVSLMPKEKGRNSIFQANAQTLVTGLMRALVELRDNAKLDLSIDTIRDYFALSKFVELTVRKDLSIESRKSIETALSTVGWRSDKPLDEQTMAFSEQFGYAAAYFGLTLASLTSTYGHIYRTILGEVDMYDVIKNRRILVVLLPSMEKAPQEMENLGKIVLSAIRNACAVGLGERIEGTVEDVLESLPTNSVTPMVLITDEYAAITTPGYPQVFTQGRGLGVAAALGSQDYPGMKGADENGAKQIVANTKLKVAMKLEECEDTWNLFKATAGTAKVMQTTGYEARADAMITSYKDKMNVSAQQVDRIHLSDLKNQIQGEFHGLMGGSVVRATSFYADIQLDPQMQLRVNQGLNVVPPVDLDCFAMIMEHLADDWFSPLDIKGQKKNKWFDFTTSVNSATK
jgi:intracellular multiplication protein IcmO